MHFALVDGPRAPDIDARLKTHWMITLVYLEDATHWMITLIYLEDATHWMIALVYLFYLFLQQDIITERCCISLGVTLRVGSYA